MKTMFGIKGFDIREYAISANALLGIRDSGKTYTASEATEELFDAGIPSIWFDPIGVAHNLRVPGKGKGYPIVVAGGMHGDLPLTTKNCGAIVRAAMESGISLVIDLFSRDLAKADWRRIVRECTEILLHENNEFGLRHIFIEEAAEFVPQHVRDGDVFAAVEKVVRMGGNSKLGVTLINQRSADINKSVLELCANVFVHRQKGKNTISDLKKWFELLELTDQEQAEIAKSLPNLKSGECWALLHDLPKPIFLKVPEKNSLHPDRRATVSKAEAAARKPVPADAFVEAMKAKLAPKAAPAKPEKSMGAMLKTVNASGDRAEAAREAAALKDRERAFAAGKAEGFAEGWALGWPAGWNVAEKGRRAADVATIREAADRLLGVPAIQPPIPPAPRAPRLPAIPGAPPREKGIIEDRGRAPRVKVSSGNGAINGPMQRIIDAIMWWNEFGIEPPNAQQVGFLAGYSPKSGTWDRYMSSLRSEGLIEKSGMILTAHGHSNANPPEGPLDAVTLRYAVLNKLDTPLRRLLEPLLVAYPDPLDPDELGMRANYTPGTGTWDRYMSSLRSLELIERKGLKAQDWLFPQAAQ